MYRLDKYNVRIVATINPGFYRFPKESGEGKTYLNALLNDYASFGEPVAKFDYSDYMQNTRITDRLHTGIKLFHFDRMDMYYSLLSQEDIDYIKQMSKYCIITADLKGHPKLRGLIPKRTIISYNQEDLIQIGW